MDASWALRKAVAFSQGWRIQLGAWPNLHAVIFGLSQTAAETRCGDAWPGLDGVLNTADDSHNWGACTLRALNAAERAAVAKAGIVPTVGTGHEARARAAQQAIVDAGLPLPNGEIHCDSAPSIGPYFTYFAVFRDYEFRNDAGLIELVSGDVSGAAYYCRLAAGSAMKPKALFDVMMNPNASVDAHARAAYAQRYFTGVHDPKLPGGAEKNISDYVAFMGRFLPSFASLLSGFDPAACEPVPAPFRTVLARGDYGEDVREMQGFIGAPQDGGFGPKTEAYLVAFRLSHGLGAKPTVWDQACRDAYEGTVTATDPVMARLNAVELGVDWEAFNRDRDAVLLEV